MKVSQAIGCALAILLSANTAQARSGNTYQSSPSGSSYVASATWYGATTPLIGGNLAQSAPMNSLIDRTQGYYLGIQEGFNNALRAKAAEATGITVKMKYPSGVLSGTLNASVSGLPDGNLHLTLDGLRYNAVLQANGSTGPLSFECNVSLTIAGIRAELDYNPYTGQVVKPTVYFEPSQQTGCDNSLDWVPLVGDFINGKLMNLAGLFVQNLAGLSGMVLDVEPQRALLGFVDAIQANTYLYGGVDVGMYLKNNIRTLYMNKQIRLSVAQPASFYVPTQNYVPSPTARTGKALGIEFLDNGTSVVGFQVNLTRTFNWVLIAGEE